MNNTYTEISTARIRIEAIRHWNAEVMRQFCINREFYTRGDCDDYDKMLRFVNDNPPNTANIYKVAMNILNHSVDIDGYGVEAMMSAITSSTVRTDYRVIEDVG